jgi:SAM-dependent methyltransferase
MHDMGKKVEGFSQSEPYVLKQENNIYDDFYCDRYDSIHVPKHRVGDELLQIIRATQPSVKNSVFLDIGSGTGMTVNELQKAGYRAFGIDRAEAMVRHAEKQYPDNEYQHGDILDPMMFEKNTFTHILCTYYTIYHFADKKQVFYHCYQWLQPHGYLALHLVEPETYDTITPAAKCKLVVNPHKYEENRITDTIINFSGLQYKMNYDFTQKNGVSMSETFVDKTSQSVRKYEQTLYMMNLSDILAIAQEVGFSLYAKFDLKDSIGDPNQFIYLLEKM